MKIFSSISCARIVIKSVLSFEAELLLIINFNFQESTVKFHVVGLKCTNTECGGYNTTRTQKRTATNKASSSSSPSEANNDDSAPSSSNNRDNVA